MPHPITFVSLGPGDPELITLKALRALQEADIIFTPATQTPSGEFTSRAQNIVSTLGVNLSKIESFVVPMSRDREATLKRYAEVAAKALEAANGGTKVAITAEGDAGFYSSAQYIEEEIWRIGGETARIAGVPAFIDCARLACTHIVNQNMSLEVMARVESLEALEAAMSQDKSIVLMKISQWEGVIKSAIRRSLNHTFYYIESCGVEGKEFYTSDKETLLERKFPYFAILIIKG